MQSRTALLIGEEAVERLGASSVAIIGLGGVGGYVAEALARCGVGKLLLCDGDVVNESNINRQIAALYSTIGQKKTAVLAQRMLDINPQIKLEIFDRFISRENLGQLNLAAYDFVADAIDSVEDKVDLIDHCFGLNVAIISCMGAGNRLVPKFDVADIYSTHTCPLAKTIRSLVKKRGITSLKTVFSPIPPAKSSAQIGSVSFVPSVAGLTLASHIVQSLIS